MTDRTELRRLLDEASKGSRPEGRAIPGTNCWIIVADAPALNLIRATSPKELRPILDQLDTAEAALARVRELHERWPIHGDGDHPEDCDCGDPWVTVCRLCCTDGKDQHETCAVYHDHGPDKPICPTIAAIGGEQS